MNARVRPWAAMSRQEKAEAVAPLLAAGHAYSTIAWELGATSRSAVATIAAAIRKSQKPKPSACPERKPDGCSRPDARRADESASPILSRERRDWASLRYEQKRDAVLPLLNEAESNNAIAARFTNCSEHKVAEFVRYLRFKGETVPKRKAGGRHPVSQPTPSAKIIALPRRSGRKTVSAMVEAFIAQNGIRRFEQGCSTDIISLRRYLLDRGYDVLMGAPRGGITYTVTGHGKPKRFDRAALFRFVDRLRAAEGLEPFLPPERVSA